MAWGEPTQGGAEPSQQQGLDWASRAGEAGCQLQGGPTQVHPGWEGTGRAGEAKDALRGRQVAADTAGGVLSAGSASAVFPGVLWTESWVLGRGVGCGGDW